MQPLFQFKRLKLDRLEKAMRNRIKKNQHETLLICAYYIGDVGKSTITKIRPQAKIDNFAFKNINIIFEGLF